MTRKTSKTLAAGAMALIATTAPTLAGPNEDAFAAAGYTMCDAKLLQLAYDDNLIKRVISWAGEKIREGYEDQVKQDIVDGRAINNGNLALCPADEFYSQEDIMLFAKYWNLDSISEAKEKIADLLIDGYASSIAEDIEMAR